MKFALNKKWLPDPAVFFLSFVIILVLAQNHNFPEGKIRMGGEVWSDKAYYYAYLPAVFIYHFDPAKYPENIETKTGVGHLLDLQNNKILIKTTCGVSILVAPFFLAAQFAAPFFHEPRDGISMIYQRMAVVAGVFYLILGLFFLKKVLDYYLPSWISYLTLIFLLAGTNLYFYGLDDVLMSHVYSFFLLSLMLYLFKRFLTLPTRPFRYIAGICTVFSLLILIRPTNALMLLILVFLDVRSMKDLLVRLKLLIKPTYFLTFIVVFLIIFTPQMVYWNWAWGSPLYYSYPGESFTHLNHPMIIPMWFSPLNGLFLYNPILLFFIAGMILMILKKNTNGIFFLLFFLLISYIFSSWCVWYYGGSYGSRPFVEYYPVLCIPFGYLSEFTFTRKKWLLKIIFTGLVLLFSFYNLRLIKVYRAYSGSTWNWDDFILTLDRAGLYNLERDGYTFVNDFENITFNDGIPKTISAWHTYSRSGYMIEDIIYTCRYTWKIDEVIRHKAIKTASLSFWIRPEECIKTGSFAVFKITDAADSALCIKFIRVDDFPTINKHWTEIAGKFVVPDSIGNTNYLSFYLWNKNQKRFYFDDLKIVFDSRPEKTVDSH